MIEMLKSILIALVIVVNALAVRASGDLGNPLDLSEPTQEEKSQQATEIIDTDMPLRSLEGPIDSDTYVLGPSDELLLILRGPDTRFHLLRVLPEQVRQTLQK
jgi:hypothetical protein